MEGTLYFNPNNATQIHSIFVKLLKRKDLFRHAKDREWSIFTYPKSKLSKFRILPYAEIVVCGQNEQFQAICQKNGYSMTNC